MNVSEESSSMLRVNRGRGGEGSGGFFFFRKFWIACCFLTVLWVLGSVPDTSKTCCLKILNAIRTNTQQVETQFSHIFLSIATNKQLGIMLVLICVASHILTVSKCDISWKQVIQLSAVQRMPIELIWLQPVLRNKLSVKSRNEINRKVLRKSERTLN